MAIITPSLNANKFWQLSSDMRPGAEFFDRAADPHCVRNLAAESFLQDTIVKPRDRMETTLKSQSGPCMAENGNIFDQYPNTSSAAFYEKCMRCEKVDANWVSPTDLEKESTKKP